MFLSLLHFSSSSLLPSSFSSPPLPLRLSLSVWVASRGPSRLTMIDVCSSMKMMTVVNKTRSELPQTGLPSVLYSLLTGNRNIPSK